MKSLLCACLVAVLVVLSIPVATHAASTTLLTGKMSATFLKLRRGTAVTMVEAAADGSRVDLIGPGETIEFYFDPVKKTWPREIERIIERSGGRSRAGFSAGEVNLQGHVATFKGHGFIPINRFNFLIQ